LSQPEDPAIIDKFRQLLEQHIGLLPPTEAKALLMMAINQGIRRINQGDKSAIRRTLDFYLFGLEQKLLLDERGELSKFTYNNVLMSFLALKAWEEASAFLEQYKVQFPEKERDNVYRYNLAICLFRQGEYEQTLEVLRDVRFTDPMYNLESRKMLLKIYFEQGENDALEYLLDNLLTWLRRHGELGYHREMYRNLARFMGRLLRLAPGDRAGRDALKQKIQDTPLLAERAWLLGVLER
jgi:tetratricopeptide (TPR) repeat protein